MKRILALTVLAAGFSTLLAAQEVDREKLQSLYRSGKALEDALVNAASAPGRIRELCRKVDIEAQKIEHGITSKDEKYIYDLYSTAAAESLASLERFEKHRSPTRLDVDLMPVREYLRIADDTYNGRPHAPLSPREPAAPPVAAPRAEPSAPPAAPVPPPAPAPAPPPPPSAVPAPPPPLVAAPSTPPASIAPPPSPAINEPPPPAPKATAPEAIASAPAPPVSPPAQASPSRPAPTPHPRPLVDANPNAIRKAADRVKVEKKEDAVLPCELAGEISVPGKSVSGVYDIGGHNYYYGSGLELARFKTVEIGGDTLLLKSSSRSELVALAYRCADFR